MFCTAQREARVGHGYSLAGPREQSPFSLSASNSLMDAHGNLPKQQTARTEFRSQRCAHVRAAPGSPSTRKSRAAQAAAFLETGSRPPALCQRKHQRDGSRTHLTNVMTFFQQASLPFAAHSLLGRQGTACTAGGTSSLFSWPPAQSLAGLQTCPAGSNGSQGRARPVIPVS